MNDGVRKPFWLALAVSMLLHVGALLSPGWGLPGLEAGETETMLLDARLVSPAVSPPVLSPAPAAKPRLPAPKKAAATPVSTASAKVSANSPVFLAPPESAPADESQWANSAAASTAAAPQDATPSQGGAAAPVPPAAETAAVPPAPTFAAAARWPPHGRIVFQVTRGEGGLIVGESVQRWTHDGERYELTATTETIGLAALFRPAQVTQTSAGGFDAHGLRPERFASTRDGKPKDSVRFAIDEGRILLGNGRSGALPAGAQDLLSLFYQLGGLPADVSAVPEIRITVATGRKIAEFRVTLRELENLSVPAGEFRVRPLRVTGDKTDDATEIWIDVATGLPVKIRHRDRKGEVFDQIATLIDVKEAP